MEAAAAGAVLKSKAELCLCALKTAVIALSCASAITNPMDSSLH